MAKEIGISSKELISKLKEFDLEVVNHMSALEDEEVNLILEYYKADKKDDEENKESLKEETKENNNSNKSSKKNKKKNKNKKKQEVKDKRSEEENLTNQNTNDDNGKLILNEKVVVKDLAEKLNVSSNELIMKTNVYICLGLLLIICNNL